jgi:hypothetical protein
LHYLITVARNNKNVIDGTEHEKGRNKKELTAKEQETVKKLNILKCVLMMI